MIQEGAKPSTTNKSEPLFIKCANFHFIKEPVEKFFKILEDQAALPREDLLIYIRTENDEFFDDTSPLTESEKAKISEELESEKLEFRKLLLALTFVREDYEFAKENYQCCVESINSLCAEIPMQFSHHKKHTHKKHFGKLDLASPSLDNIEEVGWANFILGLMAIDLGKYLMGNPAERIKLCLHCKKFFIHRNRKAKFCSEDCHDLYHRKGYGKTYFLKAVRKNRRLKKEKRGATM